MAAGIAIIILNFLVNFCAEFIIFVVVQWKNSLNQLLQLVSNQFPASNIIIITDGNIQPWIKGKTSAEEFKKDRKKIKLTEKKLHSPKEKLKLPK